MRKILSWLFGPEATEEGIRTHLLPRWIFLRCLGLIYFSAFYSLLFQIKGLIGVTGILPAGEYLADAAKYFPGIKHFWFAPTLLWLSSTNGMLMLLCWAGLLSAIALVLNLWPRMSLAICFVCFLSFVAAAQDFSGYQSDGMLLEAGFISWFFAPPRLRPGLGMAHFPSRVSRFLLQWEWFRIYFESGVVKLASGDYSWRRLTAMDDYYQNCPLPTWIGWYVQHLPHKFHAFTVLVTFLAELILVFMLFLPRRWRIVCFLILTPFQIGIILTANYTFLNYLVLVLGFLLLDDGFLRSISPGRWRKMTDKTEPRPSRLPEWFGDVRLGLTALVFAWIFYVTTALLFSTLPSFPRLPRAPVLALEPFRIANSYGLFAVMTHARYEIEFQGSQDGQTWIAYPFRYKPQALDEKPGIYAPYQPRFDWNLWFASLGSWRENPFVLQTEARLLQNDRDVLALFAGNPFAKAPPEKVRTVIWQYWFTDMSTKRREGLWWRRELIGEYAPALQRLPDGTIKPLQNLFNPEEQSNQK